MENIYNKDEEMADIKKQHIKEIEKKIEKYTAGGKKLVVGLQTDFYDEGILFKTIIEDYKSQTINIKTNIDGIIKEETKFYKEGKCYKSILKDEVKGQVTETNFDEFGKKILERIDNSDKSYQISQFNQEGIKISQITSKRSSINQDKFDTENIKYNYITSSILHSIERKIETQTGIYSEIYKPTDKLPKVFINDFEMPIKSIEEYVQVCKKFNSNINPLAEVVESNSNSSRSPINKLKLFD